jgi:hypothetical protein
MVNVTNQAADRGRTLESIERLERHIVAERYRGYDPYDALASPLFRVRPFRTSKVLRLGAQQVLRRLPVNVRPVLGIPKGYNPVTLALVLEACAYLAHARPDYAGAYHDRAQECLAELTRLRSRGYSGDCWGYDFDWEGRYARIPAGLPTIVATGIVTNALFAAHEFLGLADAAAMCERASRFVLRDMPRTDQEDGTFCWAYSPVDRQRVLNATMKGARLCAQVYALTGDEGLRDAARRTIEYVVAHQREDGSWPYALDARTWADNFHTAYVLDALDSYEAHTGDLTFVDAKERGWGFYRENFFVDGQIPKYYANRTYPIDATACAQSMLTLCRFGDIETASRVAAWAISKLQRSDGHFAYQLRRRWLVKIPYMRWSSAYMYVGLSRVLLQLRGNGAVG